MSQKSPSGSSYDQIPFLGLIGKFCSGYLSASMNYKDKKSPLSVIIQHAKRTVLMVPVGTVSCMLCLLAHFPASGSPGTVSGLPAEFSVLSEELHSGKLP